MPIYSDDYGVMSRAEADERRIQAARDRNGIMGSVGFDNEAYNARSSYLNMQDVYANNRAIRARNADAAAAYYGNLYGGERDAQRDARQQQYAQQNMYQREAADLNAQWLDNVAKANNAGLQFSAKAQQEMNTKRDAFRKNVVNAKLPEGLKQQANVEYNRQMMSFMPDERVVDEAAEANGSMRLHKESGRWLNKRYDSQGRPVWEPIGGSGGGGDPAKEASAFNKQTREREDDVRKMEKEIRSETIDDDKDPRFGERRFVTPDEIDAELRKRFASDEAFYTSPSEGQEPHLIYQREAQRQDKLRNLPSQYDRKAPPSQATGSPQQPPPSPDDWESMRGQGMLADPRALQQQQPDAPPLVQPTAPASQPPAKRKPVTISSTNIDDHLQKVQASGDQEATAALQIIKVITAKYNGAPPKGSEDFAHLIEAMRVMEGKGIPTDGAKRSREKNAFQDAQGGWSQ